MNRFFVYLFVLMISSQLFDTSRADVVLWYNGDFPAFAGVGTGNEISSDFGTLNVFDDFTVSDGGWIVNRVWSNNSINRLNITQAFWSIRTGIADGVAGTEIASGLGSATQTPTGRSGIPHLTEYKIEVTGLDVNLAPGRYWLSVAPVVGTDGGVGGFLASYLSSTDKTNATGQPSIENGESFLKSTVDNYAPLARDYSMGLAGSVIAVPEPSSLLLTAVVSTAFCSLRARRFAIGRRLKTP